MATSYYRGHKIFSTGSGWFYLDTKEPTVNNDRPCGNCEKAKTKEGHDGCIGTLPNVMNACCGHGVESEAYVQFSKDLIYRGKMAINYIEKHHK